MRYSQVKLTKIYVYQPLHLVKTEGDVCGIKLASLKWRTVFKYWSGHRIPFPHTCTRTSQRLCAYLASWSNLSSMYTSSSRCPCSSSSLRQLAKSSGVYSLDTLLLLSAKKITDFIDTESHTHTYWCRRFFSSLSIYTIGVSDNYCNWPSRPSSW